MAAWLLGSAGARTAHADQTERSCTPSFERAQELRAHGKRLAARAELAACVAVCPEELRRYCVTWLAEVEAELVSVVVVAKRAGASVPMAEVRVAVDGVEQPLSGDRLVLEPGPHRLDVLHRGEMVTMSVHLDPGAAPRAVVATFRAPPEPPPSRLLPQHDRGPPVLTWVLVGLGGAALTASAVLAINGHRLRADLVDECAPGCEPDSIESIRTQWVGSAVLAAGGAGALLGAFIVAATAEQSGPRARISPHGRF
jgi:hypothetical protein